MAYQSNNIQSPAAEYLYKLQMIVSNTDFKNKEEANKYETTEIKLEADKYIHAVTRHDSFDSYDYDDKLIYQTLLDSGYPEDRIYLCLKDHSIIPVTVKNELLFEARDGFINRYVEKNKYYCNLAGIPFSGTDKFPADRILTIPDEFYNLYSSDGTITRNQPIHELPPKYQELFMNSSYYTEMINTYQDAEYLKHIGSKAVPIVVSRKAHDGEIMNINTKKLSGYHRKFGNVTVTPDIVHLFANVYKETRDYVYNTLRGDFSSIYPNYNSFIRFLTIYMAIGQSLNELMKKSSSMAYMNNISANNYFMLYGLPSVIMEGTSMISFLKKLRMLLMDKGTNIVYRVKDYVGYKYTDIYSLIMVKQQIFENGKPKYKYDDEGNPTPLYNIVFRRMGTTADKTSYFKFRDEKVEYDWREIASGDPRWWWWNDSEIDSMLYDMNYTLSNSKYIQLSTHMSMSDIFWQSVILLRGLLDIKRETKFTPLAINYDTGDSSSLNVFDAVLILINIMNWNMTLINGKSFNGKIYNEMSECIDKLFNGLMDDGFTPNELTDGGPFKVSSFNLDIRVNDAEFLDYELPTYDYLNKDGFMDMLTSILDNVTKNTGELMMNDVKKLYDFLTDKLQQSRTIHEFRQVTETYKHLFLVDPMRNRWYEDWSDVIDLLSRRYEIPQNDIRSFMGFCASTNTIKDIVVKYNDVEYTVSPGFIMNNAAESYKSEDGKYMFRDYPDFVNEYCKQCDVYESITISESDVLSSKIKTNYQGLLKDKVLLDLNTDVNGPDTFEGLLMIENPTLYTRLLAMRYDKQNLLYFMRAIIKGLETYTASSLSALEFSSLGETEYIRILKEIISYFKSYMVEFTKEEFYYVMDGLFDNGGNSNMLRLYDEIHDLTVEPLVKESLTLYDITNNEFNQLFADDNAQVMYDEAIIRAIAKYSYIKSLGYDILFDDGKKISKTEPANITDDSDVIGTMVRTGNTYSIIIPTSMLE